MSRAIRGLEAFRDEIQETLSGGGEKAVKEAMPSLGEALSVAPNLAAQMLTFAGTLFFFLLTQDSIYAALPTQREALRCADRAVSRYFVTVTMINAGLGVAVFGAMTLIGLPNAILWGAAAFLLNFVLYLGPVLMLIALTVVGVTQFNGAYSLAPPLVYFLINMSEAQFVTPSLVGQQMQLNPLGVFLAILFGLWLWGPVGGIVSIPVLVWVSAFWSRCDFSQTAPHKGTAEAVR